MDHPGSETDPGIVINWSMVRGDGCAEQGLTVSRISLLRKGRSEVSAASRLVDQKSCGHLLPIGAQRRVC